MDAEERKIKMSNNYNSNQLDRLVNEIEGRLNDFDTGITDKDETIKSFAELIIKCAETAVNSIPMQAGVILHCRNCNKPIKEFLRIDTDEDETICLPFCDEQCMDAYKEQDPDYFS